MKQIMLQVTVLFLVFTLGSMEKEGERFLNKVPIDILNCMTQNYLCDQIPGYESDNACIERIKKNTLPYSVFKEYKLSISEKGQLLYKQKNKPEVVLISGSHIKTRKSLFLPSTSRVVIPFFAPSANFYKNPDKAKVIAIFSQAWSCIDKNFFEQEDQLGMCVADNATKTKWYSEFKGQLQTVFSTTKYEDIKKRVAEGYSYHATRSGNGTIPTNFFYNKFFRHGAVSSDGRFIALASALCLYVFNTKTNKIVFEKKYQPSKQYEGSYIVHTCTFLAIDFNLQSTKLCVIYCGSDSTQNRVEFFKLEQENPITFNDFLRRNRICKGFTQEAVTNT